MDGKFRPRCFLDVEIGSEAGETVFLHATREILKVFSVMFSTLRRAGFVLVRQSIVLCSQERFER